MNAIPASSDVVDRPLAATALDHLSLLCVQGKDARAFLDAQLTRNVPADRSAGASPFGYCSPKGRLLANGVVWCDDEAIWLILSRDLAAAIAKRLKMYVLRSKVTIDDASDSLPMAGVVGDGPGLAPWAVDRVDGRTWIRFPGVDRRFLRIGSSDGDAVASSTWRWLDIRAGLPWVSVATQDRFVPQMLNLEALDGVDFRKGCFPGQEIVARSQYLGKLKRRMALASLDGAVPDPGTDVWAIGDTEATGLVVNAERGVDGRVALLVELPLARFASSELRVGSVDGPALVIEPLPYVLPDNEVFVRPKL